MCQIYSDEPYTNSAVILSGFQPTFPGDYNNDGIVDTGDYVVWRHNFGLSVILPNDSTPGTVAQSDYDVWRAHFGQTAASGFGSSLSAAVPEPATVLMLMFAVAGWCLQHARAA